MAQAKIKGNQLDLSASGSPVETIDGSALTNVNADTLDNLDSTYFAPINNPQFTGNVGIGIAATERLVVNGNIELVSGQLFGLPSTPSGPNYATSKAYVDNLAVSGTTWKNPIIDPDLVGIASALPGSPTLGTGYLKYGGTQNETWGGVTNVVDFDYLYYTTGGSWVRVENISGKVARFGVAWEHGSPDSSLTSIGFAQYDLIQYNGSGAPTSAGNWSQPEGVVGPGSPEIPQGTTVLVSDADSQHTGHSYLYDAENNVWIEISGPASINAGNQLAYDGNTLNVLEGAGSDLDADLLDGQEGTFYQNASNLNAGTVPTGRLSGTYSINITGDADTLDGQDGSFYQNASNLNAGTVPSARLSGTYAIDISGDADTLDGLDGSQFLRSDTGNNYLRFNNLEDTISSDGVVAFDSSEGMLIYRTQQPGDVSGNNTYVVLDRANISGGSNIDISGGVGSAGAPVTFSVSDSPSFTGTPTAPTPPGGNNSTRIATTAFVQGEKSSVSFQGPIIADGPIYSATAFNVTSSGTSGTYRSIGPSGSGTQDTWSALDSLPSDVDWIKIRVIIRSGENSGTSGAPLATRLLIRSFGASDVFFGSNTNTVAECQANVGSNNEATCASVNEATINVDSQNRFEYTFNNDFTLTVTVIIYLVAYGKNG